jgi:multiple sugar transport system permease protein
MNPTFQWENLAEAWTRARIGDVLGNTAIVALGTTAATLVVSFSCAYVLSVLRPRWAPALNVGIMVTLFIPGVISLVPLYLTVVKLPILGVSLINNYAATWLPAAANAFIILIVKRFFDAVPRDLVEAARIDGAGPVRILVSVYLPLSAPIAGVVALLTVVASWKDFLWPLLVLPSPSRQPISVALAKLDGNTALNVQLAAMFLALLVPVLLFMVFQRQFLQGAGMAGAVKG